MIRRFILAAAILGIAACAASTPPAPEPVAQTAKPAEPAGPVASSSSTSSGDQLEVVAVPEVPLAGHTSPPPEVTCYREQELGSRRIKRICRTQAEMDLEQDEAKQTLDELRRIRDLQKALDEF